MEVDKLLFWMKKKPIPDNHIPVTPVELDNILAIIRYWYGIEVDHWINSEASKYRVMLRISDFASQKDFQRLSQYFSESVNEAKRLNKSSDTAEREDFDGTFADFLGVTVEEKQGDDGKEKLLEVSRLVSACRIHYPVKNWFFFTDERQYDRCDIDLFLVFKNFGETEKEHIVRLKLRILEDDKLAVVGFEANNRVFDKDFSFLTYGLKVLNEIDQRILDKYREGKRDEWASLEGENWFFYECESDEEARILHGVNETLDIGSRLNGKFVEFKMQEHDIPGLLSYVKAGLPHQVFSL